MRISRPAFYGFFVFIDDDIHGATFIVEQWHIFYRTVFQAPGVDVERLHKITFGLLRLPVFFVQ
jgi:hypothetical protein